MLLLKMTTMRKYKIVLRQLTNQKNSNDTAVESTNDSVKTDETKETSENKSAQDDDNIKEDSNTQEESTNTSLQSSEVPQTKKTQMKHQK